MTKATAWETAASADGTTPSERALTTLARKAFLSLWSYSNVFTDEGRTSGKGDGKELCDLLVVFGNNVLMFSDKHCAFPGHSDIKVAWSRWYRSAIEKSVRQLAGAEKFARGFPGRVFLDKGCQFPLPIELPSSSVARYYLIAVTRGSYFAARTFFGGGSSGSAMLNTDIRAKDHYDKPFQLGFPLSNGRFVHVLDEITVDLLLSELDTVPDLVSYLRCKEEFLQQSNVVISVPGEEELLARYMATLRNGKHALPRVPTGTSVVALPQGDWDFYASSPQREAKKRADELSYVWDSLIEHQSSFIRAGTAITVPGQSAATVNHERIVRALAEQDRLARRELSADLRYALSRSESGQMFARIKMTGSPPGLAFVFLTIPVPVGESYETYREKRMHALTVYCHAIKDGMPTLREVVGIATEPLSEKVASHDFMYVDVSDLANEELTLWRKEADELDILRPKTEMKLFQDTAREFPIPFRFGGGDSYLSPEGALMNRAERRKAAKESRRERKKAR